MSSLANINLRPKLIPYLVQNNFFAQKPLVVVDVGSRGGYEAHWNLFRDQLKIFGFDPDEKECKRLSRLKKEVDVSYLPYALWETSGYRKFYVMSNSPSSSFFKPKLDFWKRFPDEINLKIRKKIKVKTITLDTFVNDNNLGYVDFIKLDIEGAELGALKGAKRLLNKTILGVTCEIVFEELLENAPAFCEIDSFLRRFGFKLFDLGLFRKLRKPMSKVPELTTIGQVISGHGLYFRDGVSEIRFKAKGTKYWEDIKVFKLAALMEIFGLADCAIELIETAKEYKLIDNFDFEKYKELLIRDERGFLNSIIHH